MNRYAAEVSYDGGKFFGWQIQPELPTVQQALEEAISKINGRHTPVAGAGRTDTGVHAKGQVCSFDMAREWEPRRLLLAANAHLPEGVSLMRAAAVRGGFHARFSAKEREYRYIIWNASAIYPHIVGKVCWIKPQRYDWGAAAAAAKELLGSHDFRNFCRLEGNEQSTVRKITKIRLIDRRPLVVLQIKGDGFLHNMVRIILGNLEMAALGQISPPQIRELLNTEKSSRSDGGRTFPACGLYLWKISYGENLWQTGRP